ncbi:hypothetical protein [Marinobacter sp. CA1]|uniref:hypothetical protein n=1 Tax=Marinobacter sp. CA1 TaxID=2817656 RepID=UPI001D06DE61|nr:hypothetical protein [Marinobacter sp. CA1]MCG8517307.1 hypothetical protein [Pseudomonadales bacterium]UDL03379.1 hypothetical protein J2887_11455 [Marinobacter sp. CA1]
MDDVSKPGRWLVDATFWLGHIALIVPVWLVDDFSNAPPWALPAGLVGLISLIVYFFAIGVFAHRMGRSAIVWGGLACLLSPLGVWGSYLASFFIEPRGTGQFAPLR